MIATAAFFLIVGLLLAVVIGISLAANIVEPEIYFLFWLMYIITVATLVNIGFSIYYYTQTKDKRGPRGPRGPRGDTGDSGPSGKCDPGCRNKICTNAILEQMAQQIRQLSADPSFQSADIRNVYILKTIRRICNSEQFQQLVPLKGPTALIDYIKGIWHDITMRLYEEGGQRYFKTVGAEQAFDWRTGTNPWDEFKKYGVYYWGLDKGYRPEIQRIKDGTVPDDPFTSMLNNNETDDTRVRVSILGFINSKSKGEVYNVTLDKRGTYIMEASMATPSKTIMQKYGNKTPDTVPSMTFMIRHPYRPDQCLAVMGRVTKWTMCDPYSANQRFQLDWDNIGNRKFRLKAYNGSYIAGAGNKMQVVDTKTVGNVYKFQ